MGIRFQTYLDYGQLWSWAVATISIVYGLPFDSTSPSPGLQSTGTCKLYLVFCVVCGIVNGIIVCVISDCKSFVAC